MPRAALIAALAGLSALAARPPQEQAADSRPPHERIDRPSLTACGGCHLDVWREWSGSLHGRAWTNANVQAATDGFERGECRACHSPESVLESGLDARPFYRDTNQADGVHCLSCHGRDDGVAAARTVPDAPCRPVADARLRGAALCWPCHEPTHGAFGEYERSRARVLGVRCQDCHMPPRADGRGRSHGAHGGLNEAFVRRALAWECAVEGDELVLTLSNRTGHRFPGEIPSRVLLVRIEFDDGEAHELVLRKPRKREARAENRLEPDERRVLRYRFPPMARGARVRILFLPLPLLPEESAFVLGDWSGRR